MRPNAVHIIVLLWMFLYPSLEAQERFAGNFSFTDQTAVLLPANSFQTQHVIAIADMNGDQLDDIIRLGSGRNLEIHFQSTAAPFDKWLVGTLSMQEQLDICIADVDRDGNNDILTGGDGDSLKLLLNQHPLDDFETVALANSAFFVQGSNFVDINNDGWIDAFVCNDTATNRVWINNKQGELIPSTTAIDMDLFSPTEMNGGNYSSVWTDIENDGDLDLYLSKCSANATGPDDPRLINQLFINDGQNNFTEGAAIRGLADNHQSWTADFQDIDNDGDMDCLLLNHYDRCRLFENDGTGTFKDITFQSAIDILTGPDFFHATMRDFNNDGYVDILVAGTAGYEFYRNLGNKTFKKLTDVFENYIMGIFVTGDLNNDGYLDVYSGSDAIQFSDVLWINERNSNNYFAINLKGVESNVNAIGCRVEIYGPWGVQVREVRSGESYGIMNSTTLYFGLEDEKQIDRVVIKWPRGQVDTYTKVLANQKVLAIEGDCLYPGKNIQSESPLVICSGETVKLNAPNGTAYRWSNGETSQQIIASEAGIYDVTVTGKFGCNTISNPIELVVDPDETPVIEIDGPTTFCSNTTTVLTASDADNHEWSNGFTTQVIYPRFTGSYSVTIEGLCASFTSEPVLINVVEIPSKPSARGDTIALPGTVTLTASGNELNWFTATGNWLGTGPVFNIDIAETTSFQVKDRKYESGISCDSWATIVEGVVDPTLEVFDLQSSGKAQFYPSPVQNLAYLELTDWRAPALQIRIVDMQGRELYQEQANASGGNQLISIPTHQLSQGMYILLLSDEEDTYSTRFIKQ